MSLETAAWGATADMLRLQGVSVSSPTVQNILIKHGMASRYDRLLKLEERAAREPVELTAEFVERFNRTALDEFFCLASRRKLYQIVEAIQADFDVWLQHYNNERPHRGYRNMGKRPVDTIKEYLAGLEARSKTTASGEG